MADIGELQKVCSQVRRDIVRMVHGCQSGHPGGSLGCVEFLVSLYFDIMNHKTGFNMDGENEDLFFLAEQEVKRIEITNENIDNYMPLLKMYDRADILNDLV